MTKTQGEDLVVDAGHEAPAGSVVDAGIDHSLLSHKFEVGEHATPLHEEPRTIPWSYGDNRVTAMPADPDRLFVYWEATDDAIARAREQLGPGGHGAWLSLRVYDTTGRLFDGSNAHGYFDHDIERGDRHWFFQVGKPASEAFVDLGMKSPAGCFAKIARSGRIEFPRREPVAWSEPEWMTVRVSTGEVQPADRGAATPSPPPSAFEPVQIWQMRLPWDETLRLSDGGHGERVERDEVLSEGACAGHRLYPVEIPTPMAEAYQVPTRIARIGDVTHIVYGPWQVVIRGLGTHRERAVVARWEVYRSWIATAGYAALGEHVIGTRPGSSELLYVGASERRLGGASELRLGGASELYLVGASERRLGGASERFPRK